MTKITEIMDFGFLFLFLRGHLDYEEKVSKYWPEFAQNGKEDVTVEMVLNHQVASNFLKTIYYTLVI